MYGAVQSPSIHQQTSGIQKHHFSDRVRRLRSPRAVRIPKTKLHVLFQMLQQSAWAAQSPARGELGSIGTDACPAFLPLGSYHEAASCPQRSACELTPPESMQHYIHRTQQGNQQSGVCIFRVDEVGAVRQSPHDLERLLGETFPNHAGKTFLLHGCLAAQASKVANADRTLTSAKGKVPGQLFKEVQVSSCRHN